MSLELVSIWKEVFNAKLKSIVSKETEDTTGKIQLAVEKEIKEVKGCISNEKLWARSNPIHLENITALEEYLVYLKSLLPEEDNNG